MQEAQSKFSVETEPETTMVIAPLDGILSPGRFATLHFRRSSPSTFMARINCKVRLVGGVGRIILFFSLCSVWGSVEAC